MNPDQLNQGSIDSLFGTAAEKSAGVPLDFAARRALTRDQMEMLAALNQPILHTLTFQLSAWLGADITLSMLAVERQLCQTFLSTMDLQGCYATQGLFSTLSTPALLTIDLSCVDVVAHYGLGGLLEYKPIETRREATLSDMALLDSLLAKVWAGTNQVWARCDLHAEFEARVLPTSVGKVFSPSDNLMIFTYVMTIAGVESSLQLCLPSVVADRLLKELHLRDEKHIQPPEVTELVLQRLGETRHTATLGLPSFKLDVSRLKALRCGDVLDTGIATSTLAEFCVKGGIVWQSKPVKFESGHRGAQIVSSTNGA